MAAILEHRYCFCRIGLSFVRTLALAGSTKDKGDSEDGKYLTNLVFTDNGLLRIDGWFKLMSSDELLTRIVFGLNTRDQIISAGMQLPRMKIPPTGKTEMEVYPGFAYFSFSYGEVFLLQIQSRLAGTEVGLRHRAKLGPIDEGLCRGCLADQYLLGR